MSFAVSYLAGGRFDPPYMPTKTKPYIKGIILEIGEMGAYSQVITFPFDVELLSVAVGTSYYEARDHWNLYVGGEKICDSIYTKDLPEGMYLMATVPIPANTEIQFEFHNAGGRPKFVWVNYQTLKD